MDKLMALMNDMNMPSASQDALISYFQRSHASQVVDLNGYSDLLVKMSPECHRIIAQHTHTDIVKEAGFFAEFK